MAAGAPGVSLGIMYLPECYSSTEEFAYILTTFPLVEKSVKQQTLNTFRDLLRLGKLPETRL